jgi:hypothetical protein
MLLDKCHALQCEPHPIHTIQRRWYATLQGMAERSRPCVEKPPTFFLENLRDHFCSVDVGCSFVPVKAQNPCIDRRSLSVTTDAPDHDASFAFPFLIEAIPLLEPLHVLAQDVEVDSHFRCIDDTRANLPCIDTLVRGS